MTQSSTGIFSSLDIGCQMVRGQILRDFWGGLFEELGFKQFSLMLDLPQLLINNNLSNSGLGWNSLFAGIWIYESEQNHRNG